MPLIEVSITKATWDTIPADLQVLLEMSVNDLALDMTSRSFMNDLEAVAAATAAGIEIHDWSQEERARFRAIAQAQWGIIATRSDNAKRVFDSLSAYMTSQGLLR